MSAHKGEKSLEVIEQEMFSLLNQIIKRAFYASKQVEKMRNELRNLSVEYLKKNED